jgi:hypothetical protein
MYGLITSSQNKLNPKRKCTQKYDIPLLEYTENVGIT